MRGTGETPGPAGATTASPKRKRRRLPVVLAVCVLLAGCGLVAGGYYFDSVPTPSDLKLPESTTVFYADGRTPMAKLGAQNRTIVPYDQMNDSAKQAIVAAEDRTFWTNRGIDFKGVLRAAWANVSGGQRQGASTLTQQYARIAADLRGVTYSRKLREAVIAWKLDDAYTKEEILGFYLNTVPFGRGAYGIEAAAQTYFGKTVRRDAPPERQLTQAEAMVLCAMVKQPEADPADPEGTPGYDPRRNALAKQNSIDRWNYIRDGMVKLGYLTSQQAADLAYPDTVRPIDKDAGRSDLDRPTGLVVNHVLAELRGTEPFRGKPDEVIRDGGYRIVTTIDKRVQDAAEAAADIRRDTAPRAVRGQPRNWQAALVAVEPGTGRVLGYYGGDKGSGADYAGWYSDEDGQARGFGQHPPGSSFKVYDLAAAVRDGISVKERFDSPDTKEFPASGRTKGSAAGPIRNAERAPCQPDCALWEATVASLNVTYFELTERLGTDKVIEMARQAGVESMWETVRGNPRPQRVDLRSDPADEVAKRFSTEVGIGQYGITVQDHANGMATFAAGGKRADAHFVRSVSKDDEEVWTEQLRTTDLGLDREAVDQMDWTLRRVRAAKLDNGWDSAGKTGTWQAGKSTTQNVHTWMVGWTGALASAVWLGTTDGKPLRTSDGSYDVYGSTGAAPIWRQFMTKATEAMKLDPGKYRFGEPKFPGDTPEPTASAPPPSTAAPTPSDSPSPSPTPSSPSPSPEPTGRPTSRPTLTPTLPPPPTITPTRTRGPR
ncbi:transglycosylase domain-containing protein [Micromonospora chalcea]|uniref:transglycosylase domain-containing protein n=1 Tax=Micromonospora TaxID=1873 RepID=UPI000DE94979|nr:MULTISPECIES: transglycosylase domain-containing protein [unclassified Micromonospora]MBQ1059541.1 penicillin-binding protein [Micromonospora sp. C41]RBQ09225.1 penicillin-binding protein [Micromonospora sp. LHW51205]